MVFNIENIAVYRNGRSIKNAIGEYKREVNAISNSKICISEINWVHGYCNSFILRCLICIKRKNFSNVISKFNAQLHYY